MNGEADDAGEERDPTRHLDETVERAGGVIGQQHADFRIVVEGSGDHAAAVAGKAAVQLRHRTVAAHLILDCFGEVDERVAPFVEDQQLVAGAASILAWNLADRAVMQRRRIRRWSWMKGLP